MRSVHVISFLALGSAALGSARVVDNCSIP